MLQEHLCEDANRKLKIKSGHSVVRSELEVVAGIAIDGLDGFFVYFSSLREHSGREEH